MDMQIKNKPEIWLNGRFLMDVDLAEISYNCGTKNPSKPKTDKGVVIKLTKDTKPTDKEIKTLEQKAKSSKEYDDFYKRMLSRVGDPEFHQPLNNAN